MEDEETDSLLPPRSRIAWSKEQQSFQLVPLGPELSLREKSSRSRRRRLIEEVTEFEARASDVFVVGADEIARARERVLGRIHGSPERDTEDEDGIALLPPFLEAWRRALERVERPAREAGAWSAVCREYLVLAREEMALGRVTQARAALGRCIEVARAERTSEDDDDPLRVESAAVVREAKTRLLGCVRFQRDLKRCVDGLSRESLPHVIQNEMLKSLESLMAQAPLSVELMALTADVLVQARQTKEALSRLEQFPFTNSDARLTLAYARCLKLEGFFLQSIQAAKAFLEAKPEREEHEPLASHAEHLSRVLDWKARGDEALLQARFHEAEVAYNQALQCTRAESRKLRATLLLARANALIGRDRLLSARSDLFKSVELDGSNQIARVRLRTVELAMESHRMARRMRA